MGALLAGRSVQIIAGARHSAPLFSRAEAVQCVTDILIHSDRIEEIDFMRSTLAAAALASLALAACSEREGAGELPPAAPVNPFADAELVTFQCGELEVAARFVEGRARLIADSQTIDLVQVQAETGTRYEAAGDPRTVFIHDGERASFTLSGEDYPPCETASGE
jgi:membrane-bound inhibitor of C-type lysozyme